MLKYILIGLLLWVAEAKAVLIGENVGIHRVEQGPVSSTTQSRSVIVADGPGDTVIDQDFAFTTNVDALSAEFVWHRTDDYTIHTINGTFFFGIALVRLGYNSLSLQHLPSGTPGIIDATYTTNITGLTASRAAFNADPNLNPNGWSVGGEPWIAFNLDGLVISPGARIDITFQSNTIPEPAAIALFCLGLLGLMAGRCYSTNQAPTL